MNQQEHFNIEQIHQDVAGFRRDMSSVKAEIGELKTEMALLQQSHSKVVEPSLATINTKLDRMSFYTRQEIDVKFEQLHKKRWTENTLSATFGALLTGVVMYIINSLMGR